MWCGGNGGVVAVGWYGETIQSVAYSMNANFCMNATPFSSLCKVENKENNSGGGKEPLQRRPLDGDFWSTSVAYVKFALDIGLQAGPAPI